MRKLSLISAIMLAGAFIASASDQDSAGVAITQRLMAEASIWRQSGGRSFDNPSLKPFERDYSLSHVSAGYSGRFESTRLYAGNGNNENTGYFDATAYIHSGKNTLWGNARYDNGRTHDIGWNESADAEIIYPYLSADETGGYMNQEHYSFSGGFASYNGKIAWGGTIGYTAGLYYRGIDPRPRNITGKLDASLGISINLWHGYLAGVSANFRKYKQSNSIIFQSEMGESKIYHLTGLGTYYYRFSGASNSTYYTGYRYGATANIFPASGKGLIASISLSRFTFDHILRDLNKLPMSSVWHNQLDAQIAWRGSSGSSRYEAEATWTAYRRHGEENIFGDPASSTYPQIGSLDMYADNSYGGTLSATYEHTINKATLSVMPSACYLHRSQLYAVPARQWLVNTIGYGSDIKASWLMSKELFLSLEARYRHYSPTNSALTLNNSGESDIDQNLINTLKNDFAAASATVNSLGITLKADYAITKDYALGISADWNHNRYNSLSSQNLMDVSIVFMF